MGKIYKAVKVRDLHDNGPIGQFEALLNEEANDGWEFHSLVPQPYEGSTDNNVAIFFQEVENEE
ncbi:hypothetical protein [Alkalihalobacillus sp. 1P02AB]|uniref:hypothetical protein n=1 Tax=Alkalihalobacillus sp. 1P02AB TaxID=3132260 RepID=UPI0039A42BB7